jgi:hypothetical protein
MDKVLRKRILDEWGISNLSFNEKVVKIFEKVRDIPFGNIGSRDPKDVYEKNKGTCSGKNFLLRELYKGIGIKTKDMICLQRWKDLTWLPTNTYKIVEFPKNLLEMLEKTDIVDLHNYLKIFVNDRQLVVDATIDRPLKKLGFYTTENWDGKSSMPLCFPGSDKIWDCGDRGAEEKERLISLLPENIVRARKEFLKNMTSWIDELRKSNKI